MNLKNTGKVCPITTNNAASCTNICLSASWNNAPNAIAINIANTPFKTSHTSEQIAALFPTVLNTFVEPAFLLPYRR